MNVLKLVDTSLENRGTTLGTASFANRNNAQFNELERGVEERQYFQLRTGTFGTGLFRHDSKREFFSKIRNNAVGGGEDRGHGIVVDVPSRLTLSRGHEFV